MKKKTKEPQGLPVVDTYETEIEYNCPVRGLVKQKVLVRRMKTMEPTPPAEEALPSKNLTIELDRKYSGLFLSDDSIESDEESVDEVREDE